MYSAAFLRSALAEGSFDELIAGLDPDEVDSYVIPGLPAPFGNGEPSSFIVARVGRVHLFAIDDSLKCHTHDSDQEAANCHAEGKIATQNKIRISEELIAAMRAGDVGRVLALVNTMADVINASNGGPRVRVEMIDMTGNEDTVPITPPPYMPGRPATAPDTVPPEWPGMYL